MNYGSLKHHLYVYIYIYKYINASLTFKIIISLQQKYEWIFITRIQKENPFIIS